LSGAPATTKFSPHEKAFYADPALVEYVQPGFRPSADQVGSGVHAHVERVSKAAKFVSTCVLVRRAVGLITPIDSVLA
jgi:hypothetical protein